MGPSGANFFHDVSSCPQNGGILSLLLYRAHCPRLQEMEETQLATLRTELAAVQSRAQASDAAYSQLRSTLAAVHSALGPQVRPPAALT
jgi:hypothetical protein